MIMMIVRCRRYDLCGGDVVYLMIGNTILASSVTRSSTYLMMIDGYDRLMMLIDGGRSLDVTVELFDRIDLFLYGDVVVVVVTR